MSCVFSTKPWWPARSASPPGLVYPPAATPRTDEIIAPLPRRGARASGIYTTPRPRRAGDHPRRGRRGPSPSARRRGSGSKSPTTPRSGARPSARAANLGLDRGGAGRRPATSRPTTTPTPTSRRASHARSPSRCTASISCELIEVQSGSGRARSLRRDVARGPSPGRRLRWPAAATAAYERIVRLSAPPATPIWGLVDRRRRRGARRDPFDAFLDLIVEEDDRAVGIFDYIDSTNIRTLLQPSAHDVLLRRLRLAAAGRAGRPGPLLALRVRRVSGHPAALRARRTGARFEEADPQDDLFPAQRFGLLDRGVAAPGPGPTWWSSIWTGGTRPRHEPVPAHQVPFVNIPHRAIPRASTTCASTASSSVDDGRPTGALPGRVLRRR